LRRGVEALSATEWAFDSENLNLRVILLEPGLVPASLCGFLYHRLARIFSRDERAAGRFLVVHVAELSPLGVGRRLLETCAVIQLQPPPA
jgi:hypothetical protein